MKKAIAFILIISLYFFGPSPVLADDSDIFGLNIQPNVMLLIDSSQSMDDEIPSTPYNPAITYNTPLTYESTKVYQKFTRSRDCRPASAPCYKIYKNSVAEVPDADPPAAPSDARDTLHKAGTPPTGTGFWTGRIGGSNVDLFYGNYLNYLACSSCSAMEAKIVIAKRVLTNLVNNVNGVRFGAMKFAAGGGAMMREIMDMTPTNKQALVDAINGMTLTSVGTVTGEQIKAAGRYYEGQWGGGVLSPIQYECQPNFAIVISDGLYTGTDPRVEAATLFTTDHRTDLFNPDLQNVVVHTVGFGLPQSDKDAGGLTALQETATAGGGSFYTADNSAQLETALQDAISQVIAATFSFASPVIPTTSTTGSTRGYFASFQSNSSRPFWQGFLKAYQRDANGLIPVDSTTGLPTGSPVWEAGDLLRQKNAADRTIYTVISGARQLFTRGNLTPGLLGVATDADKNRVVDFIRGIDVNDEDKDGLVNDERPWKLGDIFHSSPVLVSPPFLPSSDQTYKDFKSANANRTSVLIAGANDGMLHAFKETNGAIPAEDGQELWAFIPPDLLDNLKDLTAASGNHGFYVDSSPVAADICVNFAADGSGNCATASDWKTIVVFGERRGGRNYIALDITDTTNPLYLWSFTDSKMGETWSEPAIGKVKMSGGGAKYVAFVGGGYDTPQNNNSGKAVFTIDLANGATAPKLWEYYNNSSLDDRQYMNFSLPANPTAVDTDNNGYINSVYIGDVGGQLWKFDVSAEATLSGGLVTNWTGKRLFAAAPSQANPPAAGEYYPAQAIYGAPALAFDTTGNLWVYFGTGDRNHPNNTTAPNRFYGIKDNTTMANGSNLTESNLLDVTSSGGTVTQGWFFTLGSSEKVLAAADVFNNIVLFTTFTPTAAVSCGTSGGIAKLYAVQMLTGFAAIDFTTGKELASTSASAARSKDIGQGIPSKPVIVCSKSGCSAITGTTSGQLPNAPVPGSAKGRLVGWREVF